jgi:outer membrane protein OmpA-like peptidoglycan-associated protein
MLNLVNLIGGYKERVYNVSPYFGVGLIRSYQTPVATKLSGNVGILNTFRLCDALDLNIDIRGTLVPEDFDAEGGVRPGANYGGVYSSDGFLTASIGLAYKFNPRGWVQGKDRHYLRTERTTVKVTDEAALAALKADNEELQLALAKAGADAVIEVLYQLPGYLVTFEINKSKLQNRDRVNLGKIADALKNTDDSVVLLLTGYADAGTGTAKINERLSRERAEAVYNCLVNEFGVNPDRLETDYKGGVDNMFYDDAVLSRSVVVSIKK